MPAASSATQTSVFLLTAVWGKRFIDFFCEFTLPTLLSDGNIPLLRQNAPTHFIVATTQEGRAQIEAATIHHTLQQQCAISYLELDDQNLSRTSHWEIWHKLLERAAEVQSPGYALFVIPDCIYVDGLLDRIHASLERGADAIYYPLPQISLEDFLAQKPANIAPLTAEHCQRLWLELLNPKHATLSLDSRIQNAHPEYLIAAAPGELTFVELAGHPLAVRMPLQGLNYTLNPLTPDLNVDFLPIGGLSCEPILKYHEQYSHFISPWMTPARVPSLGSWLFHFRDPIFERYSRFFHHAYYNSAGSESNRRSERRLSQYLNHIETVERLARLRNALQNANCHIAASIIPTLELHRTALRRCRPPITVLVPEDSAGLHALLTQLLGQQKPDEVMDAFLATTLPGHWSLRIGMHFELQTTAQGPRIRGVFCPRTTAFTPASDDAWMGTVLGPPVQVTSDVYYQVFRPIRYRSRTCEDIELSTLRTEPTLPTVPAMSPSPIKSRLKSVLVRTYSRAGNIPLLRPLAVVGRNLYRGARGKRAVWTYGHTIPVQFAPQCADARQYRPANALNSVLSARTAIEPLIGRLGLSPDRHKVVERLRNIQAEFAKEVDWNANLAHSDALLQFEAGVHFTLTGDKKRALKAFSKVTEDPELETRAQFSPAYIQAYVRSAEFVGAELERQGKREEALRLYRKILDLKVPASQIAGRAAAIAWRSGRLAESIGLSQDAMTWDANFSLHRVINEHLKRL